MAEQLFSAEFYKIHRDELLIENDRLRALIKQDKELIRERDLLKTTLRAVHDELTNAGHQEISECGCQVAMVLGYDVSYADSGEVKS